MLAIRNNNNKKIKVHWYKCIEVNGNKLFTKDIIYPVTDATLLNKKCAKTSVHKIYTDKNHWYEFSDEWLDGLHDELNLFGGNKFEKYNEDFEEIIGDKNSSMITYEELW